MDIWTLLTGLGAFVFVSAIIAATIRVLAGTSEDSGLAILLAPLVAGISTDRGPVVREPEPAPWRFDLMTPRARVPGSVAAPTKVAPRVRSGGFARP